MCRVPRFNVKSQKENVQKLEICTMGRVPRSNVQSQKKMCGKLKSFCILINLSADAIIRIRSNQTNLEKAQV